MALGGLLVYVPPGGAVAEYVMLVTRQAGGNAPITRSTPLTTTVDDVGARPIGHTFVSRWARPRRTRGSAKHQIA